MRAMNRTPFESLFHLPTMMGECCMGAVVAALRATDDAVRIETDHAARTIRVLSGHHEAALLRALRQAGHLVEPVLAPLG